MDKKTLTTFILMIALLTSLISGVKGAFHSFAEEDVWPATAQASIDNASVTAEFTEDSGIPENAELVIEEIDADSEEYQDYIKQSAETIGKKEEDISYARAFDIYFVNEDGEHIQPDTSVKVSLTVKEELDENTQLVHFGEETEHVKAEVDDKTVTFNADSFSVYVIVNAPDPFIVDDGSVSIEDLTGPFSADGFHMYVTRSSTNYYFTNTISSSNCITESAEVANAAAWHFEETTGGYYIYTNVGGVKKYIKNTTGNLADLVTENATVFELSSAGTGQLYIKTAGENKWLQHSGSGGGIRFWGDNNNAANSKIKAAYVTEPEMPDDPYDFDGKEYIIANYKNGEHAYALLSEATATGLKSLKMLSRNDPMDQSHCLEIASGSEAPKWTFESIEKDHYYLKSDGKYLKIDGSTLTTVSEPDEYCVIQVIPGTGARAGKVRLLGVESRTAVGLNRLAQDGFNGFAKNDANEYHSLVVNSVYQDSDFANYTAHKVSVSDGVNVANKKQVIIYTRVWDTATEKYKFYAIDHNGDLMSCTESGDTIDWIGTQNNTLLWEFTEYYRPGSNMSNGYYSLRNIYTDKYIAPQLNGNQVLSDESMQITLNGRTDEDYYTTILAWDDAHYDYAGLKVENGKLVACPMSQADTFYFAVMNKTASELDPVDTIDHEVHGISMKMMDFPTNQDQCDLLNDYQGTSSDYITPGLLENTMSGDYPKATGTNRSLGELFQNAISVNRLFMESTYESSGYFQFDSTETFAHLNGSNFDVYQQLGGADGTSNTRKHGQFMPYNTLDTTQAHPVNPRNLTDIHANELSDNNPRKGETLYGYNETPNFYFGMEVSGDFIQPKDGKDAWGHDIIFEFTGDDDFWLYVDGELILDIGGIHKAQAGSVNYRTGKVVVEGDETTLYDIFKAHYAQKNGLSEDDPLVTAYLNSVFQEHIEGSNTYYTFKDYSTHEMKIYYMERGAGASNLRMRFNLDTVVPGQVSLTKEISGTDKNDYASVKFPYQIYYDTGNGYGRLAQGLVPGGNEWNVVYQNTSTRVDYSAQETIDGVTYDDVFFLKPGQIATINMPEGTERYYIRECGVDTDIYDTVMANNAAITGTAPSGASHTKYYDTSAATTEERAHVVYNNHVDQNALRTLTITKKLFDESGNPLTSAQDDAGFTMRIRLGENLDYYNQGEYYVKDANGNYCRYDAANSAFVSIGTNSLSGLTTEQLNQITFRTSPSGAASKIPADHSIEIRDLLVGTAFKVVEENYDIPVGYGKRTWTEGNKIYNGYKRVAGSYLTQEGDTENSGVIRDNSNPSIEVHNQRGWGLRAEKEWTDEDFMRSHDDTYFAVYVNGNLLSGSVRKIDSYNYTTYFFPALEQGATFSDYEIREVILTNPVVQSNGTVTYDSITPLEEDDPITLGGIDKNGDPQSDLTYLVSYEQGSGTAQRTDVVTNNRVGGLKILKTDLNGLPLEGAEFTFKQGNTVMDTYTSKSNGLVTNAYLEDGTYTITEAKSPTGYHALTDNITITVEEGDVTVSGDTNAFVFNSANNILTIKNKPTTLTVKKVDEDSGDPLSGAHFAVYKQIKIGTNQYRRDYYPISGYEDIVSGSNGVISEIDEHFTPGTYYLVETQAPDTYDLAEKSVLFTIAANGEVTIDESEEHIGSLTHTENGTIAYIMTVPNTQRISPPPIIPTGLVLRGMTIGVLTVIACAVSLAYRKRKNKQICAQKQEEKV